MPGGLPGQTAGVGTPGQPTAIVPVGSGSIA